MHRGRLFSVSTLLWFTHVLMAQVPTGYFQQAVDYTIRVTLDPAKHQLVGTQTLVYTNNSPDTLREVFYHLYFNAFQPGSSMDMRSLTIADPDSRVRDRISKLQPDEVGEYFIKSIKQDGKSIRNFFIDETILSIKLQNAILPGKKTTIELEYESQIPVQIRRTGRYNKEGIAYSMAQWYPKICAYDQNGWASNPYIGREFYGEYGSFDVFLTLPDSFKVIGTGRLVSSISTPFLKEDRNKKGNFTQEMYTTYNFKADRVHDFVWAADPDYQIDTLVVDKSLKLLFAYNPHMKNAANWKDLQPIMASAIKYAIKRFGPYPYEQYAFIQGGDGGMEYPMATLVMGDQSLPGLISVCVHELMHSWFQGVLGIDESHFHWMDEGFTSYAEELVKEHLRTEKRYPGEPGKNIFEGDMNNFISFVKAGRAEPPSIHADHFKTNAAYGMASYVKGTLFLSQLGYVIGEAALETGLRQFYQEWMFKRPGGMDIVNRMERNTGIELNWYYEYMINTNYLPDYAIDTVMGSGSKTLIILANKGSMPMPIDLVIEDMDGHKSYYTIPLDVMRKAKTNDLKGIKFIPQAAWHWTKPVYDLTLDIPFKNIKSVSIDPSKRMLDANYGNNTWLSPVK